VNAVATAELFGRPVQVSWSDAAQRALLVRTQPLRVEMELYFSCLIRKRVRFGEAAVGSQWCAIAPNLEIGFRPVMTRACHVDDLDGKPPLDDFPIVKPEAYVPRWLRIERRGGEWFGEFGY
jgi:hypothetical protein